MIAKPEINTYTSLIDSKGFTVGWKDVESFDTDKITDIEGQQLGRFFGIELEFGSAGNNLLDISSVFLDFIKSMNGYEKLLYFRGLTQSKSKIRTFKGEIKSLKIQGLRYLEQEIDDKEGSYFLSVIDLDSINNHVFSDYFFNSSQSFVLLRKQLSNGITEKDYDLLGSQIYNERYGIDYLKLLLKASSDDSSFLIRSGGDGGKTSFSMQLFVRKSEFESLTDGIKAHFF